MVLWVKFFSILFYYAGLCLFIFLYIYIRCAEGKSNLICGDSVLFFAVVFYKKAMDETALHSITPHHTACVISKCYAGEWNSQPWFCCVGFTLWCARIGGVSETRTPSKKSGQCRSVEESGNRDCDLSPDLCCSEMPYSQIQDNEASSRVKQTIPFKWSTNNGLPKG